MSPINFLFIKVAEGFTEWMLVFLIIFLRFFGTKKVKRPVLISGFKSLNSFNKKSTLYTWLYRIAVNKSLDFIRKTRRQKRFSLYKLSLDSTSEINNIPSDIVPDNELENKETMNLFFQALKKIPGRQKTAFVLSKMDDLSNKEISEIMNLSVSSVESLLFRAKANLKKYLYNFYKNN